MSYSCLRKYCRIVLLMLEECGNGPGQNARSYNIAISACSRASQWEKAVDLLQAAWQICQEGVREQVGYPGITWTYEIYAVVV